MSTPAELDAELAKTIFLGSKNKIQVKALAASVGLSPYKITQSLGRLGVLGYPLTIGSGFVERGSFQPIDVEELRARLSPWRIGRITDWRLHVGSTQDELKKILENGGDGTVLLAETQFSSRGRRSRTWFSPVGGIWMSVLLKPSCARLPQVLTQAFGVAVAKAVSDVTNLSPVLKWPNDVMVRSRKLAGVVAEAAYDGVSLCSMIVGLGVNANIRSSQFPRELRGTATSISEELGTAIDRNLLTLRILENMDRVYSKFESNRTGELLDEVRRLCCTLGARVQVTTSEARFEGDAVGIGDDGRLVVRLEGGETVPFCAADVVHLR